MLKYKFMRTLYLFVALPSLALIFSLLNIREIFGNGIGLTCMAFCGAFYYERNVNLVSVLLLLVMCFLLVWINGGIHVYEAFLFVECNLQGPIFHYACSVFPYLIISYLSNFLTGVLVAVIARISVRS